MGDGKLLCCGSPLYLKNRYGMGYSMIVEKQDAIMFDSSNFISVLKSQIPEAKLLTDVGTEISFQLPFSSSSLFQSLFEYFDANGKNLGISSYGVSVTTLEEVFITVQNSTNTQAQAEEGRNHNFHQKEVDASIVVDSELLTDSLAIPQNESGIFKIDENDIFSFYSKHLIALLIKRLLYFYRDIKSWVFLYFVPVVFLLAGLLVNNFSLGATYQPSRRMDVRMYNSKINTNYMPTPFSSGSTFCAGYSCAENIYGQIELTDSIPNHSLYPLRTTSQLNSIQSISQFLLDSKTDFKASQFGAISFLNSSYSNFNGSLSSISYVVHSNYTAVHGAPLFNSIVANSIVSFINPASSLTVRIFPLPYTTSESKFISNFSIFIVSLFLLLAIAVIPASFATHIVREREVKAKHQQIVSGVSFPIYWLSNWIWYLFFCFNVYLY
jgi:hypothetical protein